MGDRITRSGRAKLVAGVLLTYNVTAAAYYLAWLLERRRVDPQLLARAKSRQTRTRREPKADRRRPRRTNELWSVVRTLVLVVTAAALAAPAWAAPARPTLSVEGLRTEYKENPLGIDVARPRLSFKLRSDARGVRQSAYEIRVASSEAALRPAETSSGRAAG